jgi:Mn-containing catalase
LALESLGKDKLEIGEMPVDDGWVNKYFNDSTGEGEFDAVDARGPWNEGNGWEYIQSPVISGKADGQSARQRRV